jgi:F-type H+-transporting ATPase subunit d
MASRRLAASTVDWAEFARKIPEVQKASFLALKAKQDGYVRVINSLPEKTPAIDWSFYRSKIPVAGKQTFVDLFHL